MSHANAALTPRARMRLAELIVEEGWPVAVAAKMFLVSPPGKGEGWAVYAETFYRADDPVVTEGFEPWRPDGKKPKGL